MRLRRGVAVLAYHNIVEQSHSLGDVSLHLERRRFAAQLDRLLKTHRPIALDEVWGDHARGGGPRFAVTFDDAYRGAVRLAIPELVARGVPATFFVCPGMLSEPGFWWDRIAAPGGGLAASARTICLDDLRGVQSAILERFTPSDVPADLHPATLEELRAAALAPGITFGSHTWTHPNLAVLPREALEGELDRCRAWLDGEFGDRALTSHLALPYGLAGAHAVEAARAAGYRFIYRIEGGVTRPDELDPDGQLLPRLNVPGGVSVRGLELRASGLRR